MEADVPGRRRSGAVLVFAPLPLATAARQLCDREVAFAVPAVETLVAAGLLFRHRIPSGIRPGAAGQELRLPRPGRRRGSRRAGALLEASG